jgi:hypothetical protein
VHGVPVSFQPPFMVAVCPFSEYSRGGIITSQLGDGESIIVSGNHLGGGSVIRVWDQEVYFFCGFRFKSCGCSHDDHWKLTWSLTSGPVGLVEIHASWPGHPR